MLNKEALLAANNNTVVIYLYLDLLDSLRVNGKEVSVDPEYYQGVWNDLSTWGAFKIEKGSTLQAYFSEPYSGDSEIRSVTVKGGTVDYDWSEGVATWDGYSKYFGYTVVLEDITG